VDQPGVGKPGLQPAVTMETARSPKFLVIVHPLSQSF
jgi:hypothetical protein